MYYSSFFISIVLSILFFSIALFRAYMPRPLRRLGWDFYVRTAITSFALGFALGTVVLETMWFAISYSLKEGSIEQNIYPGGEIKTLLGTIVLGALIIIGWAVKSYYDSIYGRRGL